ncbi:unnamed protein product [Symbiodinium sp. CCMP2592]|nr:unnamed protein product [Symbiodinium sp. CCMP2592]
MPAEEDPEEAAAWAALREAFGEPSRMLSNAKDGRKVPARFTSDSGVVSKQPHRGLDLAQDQASGHWLQSEVDRLVGEVQRVAGQPFSAKLLQALWHLPLEEQQEALLGARALGSRSDDSVWQLLADEVHAREDKQPVKATPPTAPALLGPQKSKKQTKGPGARVRSRSRSPSI